MRSAMGRTLSIVISCVLGGNAYATCASIGPTLEGGIVTVPSDGEVGVPTDGRLWVLGGNAASVEVHWLSGTFEGSGEIVYSGETVATEWFVFDFPTDLEDEETIVYSLTVSKSGKSIVFGPFAFVTSGADKLAPEILDLYRIEFNKLSLGGRWYLSESCESLLAIQACPDGERERVVSASIETSGADLYRVFLEKKSTSQSYSADPVVILPASCKPQTYADLGRWDKDQVCLRVEALNTRGDVSESFRVCGDDGFFGCSFSSSVGSSRQAFWGLVLMLCISLTLAIGLRLRTPLFGLRNK